MNGITRYILMLEDDEEDRYITHSFFKEHDLDINFEFVTYDYQVIAFLDNCMQEGKPLPDLIILDKHVPAGNGLLALNALKSHTTYKHIPVVIVSGTGYPSEIDEAYRLGVNSYIIKPATAQLTAKKIETFFRYWFEIAELPKSFVAI